MKKRGQITLFIILGLILLLSSSLLYFLNKNDFIVTSDLDTYKIEYTINYCVSDTLNSVLSDASMQGSFVNISKSKHNLDTSFGIIPFLHYKEDFFLPEFWLVKKDITNYYNLRLNSCFNSSLFKEYSIKTGDISSEIVFFDNATTVSVNWPIMISKGTKTKVVKDFSGVSSIPFKKYYDSSLAILDYFYYYPKYIDENYLSNLEEEFNVTIDYFTLDTDFVFVVANDPKREPYFMFADNFLVNNPPEFLILEKDVNLRKNVLSLIPLNGFDLDNDSITFSVVSSDDITVDSNNVLHYIPLELGNVTFEISASDGKDETSKIFEFEVTE